MKVRLLCQRATPGGVQAAGLEIDVPKDEGLRMITADQAELVADVLDAAPGKPRGELKRNRTREK